MIKKWKKKSSKYLLNNKIFKMREDLVTSPKLGSDHSVWVMEVPTWVNIIPITTDGEVILVNQYRFCLLYTSPSPRDKRQSRMPSSA